MKERLDQDSMGIILRQNFLTEFFPGEVSKIKLFINSQLFFVIQSNQTSIVNFSNLFQGTC